ncbi:MAG: 50S ribosomal protein L23 [Armatimonadota bacterium]|nr:MAG: 50S ribosomal protein L23 [Armatimonadota bacterium]
MKDPRQILIRPLLTEKSVALVSQRKYVFEVSPKANKVEIRHAVENLFPGARVARVNTMLVRGKRRRLGGYRRRRAARTEGQTTIWKKAIVTLREGTIPAFEGL